MVDFKKVRLIPILSVCEFLGIDIKKNSTSVRGRCPICQHPSTRAFTVTPTLNRFWCFGDCHSGGDCIELYARVKQVSQYEAACQLEKHFGDP